VSHKATSKGTWYGDEVDHILKAIQRIRVAQSPFHIPESPKSVMSVNWEKFHGFAVLVFMVLGARAQDCTQVTSCVECLNTEGCEGWAPVVGCLSSCFSIADVGCYSKNTFPDANVEETCQIAQGNADDARLCRQQNDCESCVGTMLSDNSTTCQWFEDRGFCASGCEMMGCGDTSCTSDETEPLVALPSEKPELTNLVVDDPELQVAFPPEIAQSGLSGANCPWFPGMFDCYSLKALILCSLVFL